MTLCGQTSTHVPHSQQLPKATTSFIICLKVTCDIAALVPTAVSPCQRSAQLAMASRSRAGYAPPESAPFSRRSRMSFRRLLLGALLVSVARVAPVHAAADAEFREFRLRHVCKGGPNDGAICCDGTECGTGTCVVDSIGKVAALLTLVVDDEVTD